LGKKEGPVREGEGREFRVLLWEKERGGGRVRRGGKRVYVGGNRRRGRERRELGFGEFVGKRKKIIFIMEKKRKKEKDGKSLGFGFDFVFG